MSAEVEVLRHTTNETSSSLERLRNKVQEYESKNDDLEVKVKDYKGTEKALLSLILREAGVIISTYGEEGEAPRSPRKLDDHSRTMLDFLKGAKDAESAKQLAIDNFGVSSSSSSSSSSSPPSSGDLPGFASSSHTVNMLAKLAD